MPFQGLRIAIRHLSKSPGFTAMAVLMLALGIGATTAIFSIVEGVLLRPLPFPHPERLMALTDILQGADLEATAMPESLLRIFRTTRAIRTVSRVLAGTRRQVMNYPASASRRR